MEHTALEQLAEAVVERLTVPLEASGRHVHLCRAHVEALFGPGHRLEKVRDLSQPGQFVCTERVTLVGPKGQLGNVVVLGPERSESQVELSLTDGVTLGIAPPVRISGDTAGTPGIVLRGPAGELTLKQGVIAAKRHIHMTPEDARRWGLSDKQDIRLHTLTSRPVTFEAVEVRISPKFSTAVHLDYDEANACGFRKGDRAIPLPDWEEVGDDGPRRDRAEWRVPSVLPCKTSMEGRFTLPEQIPTGAPGKARLSGDEANACGFRKGDRAIPVTGGEGL